MLTKTGSSFYPHLRVTKGTPVAKKPAASAAKSTPAAPPATTTTLAAPAAPKPAPAAKPAVSIAVPTTASVGADQTREHPAPVTHADIEKRAYELWTQGAPGGPADHWLQAERELRPH